MIRDITGGIDLEVRVVPRAAKSGVAGVRNGILQVRLNAPPVDGAANRELVELVADILDVPRRAVTVVAGEKSRTKRLRISGVDAASARHRLLDQ